jgi:hypothetical protein
MSGHADLTFSAKKGCLNGLTHLSRRSMRQCVAAVREAGLLHASEKALPEFTLAIQSASNCVGALCVSATARVHNANR